MATISAHSHHSNPLELPVTRESLDKIPTSFATVSVGTPDDPLEDKLKCIFAAGFQAIELGFPDLVSFASKHCGKEVAEDDYNSLCEVGTEVAKLCKANNLTILMLQPFANFEGWPTGSEERAAAFERATGWIRVMQAVGTDMLQVGSSDSPTITHSKAALASDLRELGYMLSKHNFRLAYENWCWATVAPTWKDVWEIVQLADLPNLGLCLDTFQTAGGEWGDPTTPSGMIEHLGYQEKMERQFKGSLQELADTVPAEKIFLLQISDAYKVPAPMSPGPDKDGMRPRGRWSHDFRPYPFNGGYLPVVDVAKAVLQTGARCWFSMEVFDGGPNGEAGMKQYDNAEFCKGAMASHKKLLDACVSA